MPGTSVDACTVPMLLRCLLVAQLVAAKADYYFQLCNVLVLENSAYSSISNTSSLYMTLCGSEDYARTIVNCIVTASTLTDDACPITNTWDISWKFFNYICHYHDTENKFELDNILRLNLESPVKEPWASANQTGSKLFDVPADLLQPNIPGAIGNWKSSYDTDRFGQALLYYVFGIMLLQIIVNFYTWAYPGIIRTVSCSIPGRYIRGHISIPPLFGGYLSRTMDFYSGRLQALYVTGFLVLSMVLLTVNYDTNMSIIFDSRAQMFATYIGFRSGYLCMYKLPLLFLFALRNNFLIWLTGWDMGTFNLWHRWIGRMATIDAIVHAIAYTVHFGMPYMPIQWRKVQWIWAFVAVMCMAIMCVQATKHIRRMSYEVFLVGHVVLAVFVLIGLFVHLWHTNQCKPEWYIIAVLWVSDRVFRLARILLSGGVCTASVNLVKDEVAFLDITYSGHWQPTPGTYVFVHWWAPQCFWQAHPLTVVPTGKKKMFRLAFRTRSGLTRRLATYLQDSGGLQTIKVLIDGPYGIKKSFEEYDYVQMVAGGMGITACYSHLLSIPVLHLTGKKTAVKFDWIVRDRNFASCFEKELAHLAAMDVWVTVHVTGILNRDRECSSPCALKDEELGSCMDCTRYTTEDKFDFEYHNVEFVPGRLSAKDVVFSAISKSHESVCFFTCGPPALNRDLREAAAELASTCERYVQFYDESFSM